MTGVYLATGGAFGVFVMILFAVLGVITTVLRYPLVVFIIAFFLGPRFELSLGQTATILRGDVTNLVNHPVAVILLAMSVFSIYWLGVKKRQSAASA